MNRARNTDPLRPVRRQENLSRMRNRIIDYVPQYKDTFDGRGKLVASRYVGHKAVRRFGR